MEIYITQDGAQIEPVNNSVDCGDNVHKAISAALKGGSGCIQTTCLAQIINELNHTYIYRRSSNLIVGYVRCLIEDLKLMRRMGENGAVQPESLPLRRMDRQDAKALYGNKKAP